MIDFVNLLMPEIRFRRHFRGRLRLIARSSRGIDVVLVAAVTFARRATARHELHPDRLVWPTPGSAQ